MMREATILGGPRDGEKVSLSDKAESVVLAPHADHDFRRDLMDWGGPWLSESRCCDSLELRTVIPVMTTQYGLTLFWYGEPSPGEILFEVRDRVNEEALVARPNLDRDTIDSLMRELDTHPDHPSWCQHLVRSWNDIAAWRRLYVATCQELVWAPR